MSASPQTTPINIAILAAGAGGMICGSCLRDNALAGALMRAGHRVTLVPMYTPLRTEEGGVAIGETYYGGLNVYLQHASRLFRHTPRALDWLLDRPALLKMAGRLGTQTSPARLGPLTIDILKGDEGPVVKELRRLAGFLRDEVRPQIVSLPNLMFIGLARLLRRELNVPIVCELTGEDLFLGALTERFAAEAKAIIRARAGAGDVDRFVATSSYYAGEMARYLEIDAGRIDVVHPSVPADYIAADRAGGAGGAGGASGKVDLRLSSISNRKWQIANPFGRPLTVGYMARICPEKGFGRLVEAMDLLRRMPGLQDVRLLAGGYLGAGDRKWFEEVMRKAEGAAPRRAARYLGELDRAAKLELLDSIDVLSVPTIYAEAKGIYVLEAMARGVPVVQPAHGSFPELLELTGGGVLAPAGDPAALAKALSDLLRDPSRRAELGARGREAVGRDFTHDHMAGKMLKVYRDVLEPARQRAAQPATT